MFPIQNKLFHSRWLIRQAMALAIFLLLLTWHLSPAHTQGGFNSGSTGADGAFNPTANQTVTLPASGVFNYTTVNIPTGVTITFTRNALNTPVTILATGNVVINGQISVDGAAATTYLVGGKGGPGGFDGGRGASGFSNDISGFNGDGPGGGGGGRVSINSDNGYGGGGGFATAGTSGTTYAGPGGGVGGAVYGSKPLIPLIGGSGGGGSGGNASITNILRGSSGGGGGGAILIASSGTISGSGAITSNGGNAASLYNAGGNGSGGAIRLVANAISGTLSLQVNPGQGGASGGAGYVRVDASDLTGFNPSISPVNAVFTISPNPALPSNLSQLRIVSVAGVNAPTNPLGSFNGLTDILVPTTQTNPVTVALAASNIPTGTIVTVKVTPENGAATTVQSTALAGTLASSTATASVTLPTGICLVSATTTVDLIIASNLKPIFIDGERVNKMEISATFGGQSEITYITESGKRIKRTGE